MDTQSEQSKLRQTPSQQAIAAAIASGRTEEVAPFMPLTDWESIDHFLGLACRYGGTAAVSVILPMLLAGFTSRIAREAALGRGKPPMFLGYLFPYPGVPEDTKYQILSDGERQAVFELLVEQSCVEPQVLAFFAALHGDEAMVDRLLNAHRDACTNGSLFTGDTVTMEPGTARLLTDTLHTASGKRQNRILNALHALFGDTIPLPSALLFDPDTGNKQVRMDLCTPDIFEVLFNHTSLPKQVTRKALFRGLTAAHNEAGVHLILKNGYLKRQDLLRDCIRIVQDEYRQDLGILALLLAQLHEIEEKHACAALSLDVNPNSAAALRRSWAYTVLSDETLMITGYRGRDTHIEIPRKIGRRPVTVVGPYALSPEAPRLTEEKRQVRERIQWVEFPDSISDISYNVLGSCGRLEHVRLPQGLTRIPDFAFVDTASLRTIDIPDTVSRIDCAAFMNSSVEELFLPDALSQVGEGAFCGSQLKKVSLPAKALSMKENPKPTYSGVFQYCVRLKQLDLRGPGMLLPPRMVDFCFSLSHFRIPEGVTFIGQYAFSRCGITHITIPESVQEIQECAFKGAFALQEVIFSGNPRIGAEAFADCRLLEDVKLPERMTAVPERMFENCSHLRTPYFPPTLESIGRHAFGGTPISPRSVPKTVSRIAANAFRVDPHHKRGSEFRRRSAARLWYP